MKIGIVGYQRAGKSSLFEWLTGETANPAMAHTSQSAMAAVPESRIDLLCQVYHPKKVTRASLELVDTPGLSRDHEGSAAKLAAIREAGAMVVVVAAYGEGATPLADAVNIEDDFLIADLEIVTGRLERLREQLKKPRPNREELQKELESLEPLLAALDAGQPVRSLTLSKEQEKAIRSFQLLTNKPRLLVFNTADDDTEPERWLAQAPPGAPAAVVSLSLEQQLAAMGDDEAAEFCHEMGVRRADRDALLRAIMDASGQMLFFTAGEKEVRTWMIPQGSTAQEAAGGIHTDMFKGFIRAEVMTVDDLVRLGSERDLKAAGLLRQEHKEYIVRDGDILTIRHN